jgi:hypothetical protein
MAVPVKSHLRNCSIFLTRTLFPLGIRRVSVCKVQVTRMRKSLKAKWISPKTHSGIRILLYVPLPRWWNSGLDDIGNFHTGGLPYPHRQVLAKADDSPEKRHRPVGIPLCSTTRVEAWRRAFGKPPLRKPWNILELPGMQAGALELFRTS